MTSQRNRKWFAQIVLTCFLLTATLAASGQYPGQVTKKAKDTAVLRSVAVLEWTGEEGKPKSSRLIPVTVYDGEALQDGNVYLARPQPLAVGPEVEYQLEKNGKPIGLFDIKNAGQETTKDGITRFKLSIHTADGKIINTTVPFMEEYPNFIQNLVKSAGLQLPDDEGD